MISTENTFHLYDGDDNVTTFAFTFDGVESSDDIKVSLIEDPTAPEDAEELDSTLYTVQVTQMRVLYPLSGPPLATGAQLLIERRVDLKQETDLIEGGAYSAETIERAFDKLTIAQQYLQSQIDRVVAAPIYVDGAVGDLGEIITGINAAATDAAASAVEAALAVTNGRRTAIINAIIFGGA